VITVLSVEDVLHYRQQGFNSDSTEQPIFSPHDDATDSLHMGWQPARHHPILAAVSVVRASAYDNVFAPGVLRQSVDPMSWQIRLMLPPHEAHATLIQEGINYAIEQHATQIWADAPVASVPFFQRNGMLSYGEAYQHNLLGKCYFVSRSLTLEGSLSYLHALTQFDLDSIRRLLDGYYSNVHTALDERYEDYQDDQQLQNVMHSFGKVIRKLETFNESLSLMVRQTKKVYDSTQLE